MESSDDEDIRAELPAKKQYAATTNAALATPAAPTTPTAPHMSKKIKLDLRDAVRITAQPGIKLSRVV